MKLFRKEGFHSILGQPTFDPLVIEDGSGKPTFFWIFDDFFSKVPGAGVMGASMGDGTYVSYVPKTRPKFSSSSWQALDFLRHDLRYFDILFSINDAIPRPGGVQAVTTCLKDLLLDCKDEGTFVTCSPSK